MADHLAAAMTKVIDVLTPLDSDQRKRVIQAAFALLGETPSTGTPGGASGTATETPEYAAAEGVSQAATIWLQKAKVSKDQLDQHFHIDGGPVTVISLPGNATKKIDQVLHTYLMQGVASLLTNGESAFSDSDARDLCKHFGCYDHTNHAKYTKAFGNRITGSKGTGWKLTAPGLALAAELLKA